MADEFDTDTGVRGDYDGTITGSIFQLSERGDLQLALTVKPDDGSGDELNLYRVGTDFATFDGGVTAEHSTKSKVRADSQIATLWDHGFACGAEAVLRERSIGLGQRDSRPWLGLRFHWDVVGKPFDITDRATGEKSVGTSYKAFPSKYLGESGDVQTSPQSSTGGDSAVDVSAETMAKIKVLAQSKTFTEWVDECLTIDEVRDKLLSKLSDEDFYNSLKG